MKLCEKWGLQKTGKWYKHEPEKVLESNKCKILWGFPIETGKCLEHIRPDITVIDKKKKRRWLTDPSCPFDSRIEKREEKCIDYNQLKYEIARMWNTKKTDAILVVIGALGTVTNRFEKRIEDLVLHLTVEMLQKTCLLGTTRILPKVPDTK